MLILVVAAAGALRFWKLGAQSLWFDEYVTTAVVSKGKLIANVVHQEGSPPLYFIAVWGWTKLFGDSDTAFRSLSAVAGTVTVPVVYAVARELTRSRRIARVAAVLVALNPMFVWFSQEARAYSLFALVGSLSLLLCVRARMRGRITDLVLWGVASAAALSTHYFAVFLVLPEAAWLVLSLRRRWRRVVVGFLPLIVVSPPLLLFFSAQHSENNQKWIATHPLGFRFAEAGRQSLIGPGGQDDRLWAFGAALVAVAAVIVVVRASHRERSAVAVMVAMGATGLLLPLAGAAIGSDYFIGRNAIASLVPLVIAVAIGLGAHRAGWVGATATAGLCVLSTLVVVSVANDPALQKADWRSLAALLDNSTSDSVVVLQHDGHLGMAMLRYLRDARVLKPGESVRVQEIDLVYHIAKPVDRCGRFQGRNCEVILFPLFPKALTDRFVYGGKPQVGHFSVNRYGSAEPVRLKPGDLVSRSAFNPVVLVRRAQPVSRR
jgi:mannosyltransferase